MDLSNKIAIVTGARRGMGRTHALGLVKRGAKVVVSDISLKDCEKVVREIEESGLMKGLTVEQKIKRTRRE